LKTGQKNKADNQATLIILIFGIILLFFASGLLPLDQMWGFNHLQYFPGILMAILAFLLLMLLPPDISKKIYSAGQYLSRSYKRLPRIIQIVLLIFLCGFIFYMFRVHVHTLGDGYQRVYQVEKGYLHNPPEPLDFFLHSILYMGLNPLTGIGAETIYTSLSIIFGVIFMTFIYLFRFPETINKSTSALAKMLIISFGGMQIFFGYVESYSLLYPATLLFILYAYRYLSEQSGMITTTIIFVLALSSHQSGWMLLPAYIYLLYINYFVNKANDSTGKIKKGLPIIIILITVVILVGIYIQQRIEYPQYQTGLSEMLLPFYSVGEYSVFSFSHLLDIINEILLIAPIILILLLLFVRNEKSNRADKIGSSFRLFFLLLLIPSIIFIFMFDPKLGMARDWDLFATPMSIIGLVSILIAVSGKYFDNLSRYLKTVIIYAVFLFASIWIVMNSSAARQLTRAEKLLTISDKNRSYSLELLAHYYWKIIDNREKALELYYQIDEENRGARIYQKITQLEFNLHNYKKAINSATRGIVKDEKMSDLYLLCGASYQKLKNYPKALEFLHQARELSPTQFNIYSYLGNTYVRMDSLDRALESHKMSIKLNPNDAACYFNTAFVYLEKNVFDSAQFYVTAGLKLNPNYPGAGNYLQKIKRGIAEQGY